jgi:CRISPR-associated protein Csm1
MKEIDSLYIACLLHDIGKFIERAKLTDWQEDVKVYIQNKESSKNHAHRRYSALFVKKFKEGKKFFNESVEELILHHHNDNRNEVDNYLSIDDRGVRQKIIRIADDLASSERKEDETLEPGKYFKANLESAFNDIRISLKDDDKKIEYKLDKKYYYEKTALRIDKEGQFPIPYIESDGKVYESLVNNFIDEFKNVENEKSLLALMEKYLIHIPAQSPIDINGKEYLYKPDINLYDHSRVVAAIAVVIFDEYKNGSYKGKDKQILSKDYKNELENPAILICGNVNSIQDFIFNVKSKKAAKNLKGRSYFVQMLTDIVAKYIVKIFELKEANVLYNGGGNFFIIAPNYRKKYLNEIQQKIAKELIDIGLYLSIGFTEVTFNDFKNFGGAFDKAVKSSNVAKKEKFKGLDYKNLFDPFPQIVRGATKYEVLTEELQNTNNYYYGPDNPQEIRSDWEKVFRNFGYQAALRPKSFEKQGSVFNSLEFTEEYESFRLAVKDLPKLTNEMTALLKNKLGNEFEYEDGEKVNSILQYKRFAQLAKFDTGTEKLGVLKMDIDNMGKIFKEGLENPTIGRVAFLSRTLKWFFEGYMNTLLQDDKFKDRIYPIFSGGDDFFVVGAWNSIFEFAIKVREEFKEFVTHHPGMTLSASLLVIDENYPIKQIANLAEKRLENAKERRDVKTGIKIKNAISVFNTVLSWEEFGEAKKLKEKIKEIIEKTGYNRAIINKIQKSSNGFASIQKEILFGKVIKMYKVWRLSYYLRDLVNLNGKSPNALEVKELVKGIVKQYEELFFKAFKGEETNIQIFPVAARWAELETKNQEGDK